VCSDEYMNCSNDHANVLKYFERVAGVLQCVAVRCVLCSHDCVDPLFACIRMCVRQCVRLRVCAFEREYVCTRSVCAHECARERVIVCVGVCVCLRESMCRVQHVGTHSHYSNASCCSVLQCVAMWCSVLQCA